MTEKEQIRKELIVKRDNLSFEEWNAKTKQIAKSVLQSNIYKSCTKMFIYSDFHNEVGTSLIIEDALINGKEVYFPKVHEEFSYPKMDFYRVKDTTVELISGYMGIREPVANLDNCFHGSICNENDKLLMFVPGVAFSKKRSRIGYGKGYYDTYLDSHPGMLKCALCFNIQVCDELPIRSGDVNMDILITETTTADEIDKLTYPTLKFSEKGYLC